MRPEGLDFCRRRCDRGCSCCSLSSSSSSSSSPCCCCLPEQALLHQRRVPRVGSVAPVFVAEDEGGGREERGEAGVELFFFFFFFFCKVGGGWRFEFFFLLFLKKNSKKKKASPPPLSHLRHRERLVRPENPLRGLHREPPAVPEAGPRALVGDEEDEAMSPFFLTRRRCRRRRFP